MIAMLNAELNAGFVGWIEGPTGWESVASGPDKAHVETVTAAVAEHRKCAYRVVPASQGPRNKMMRPIPAAQNKMLQRGFFVTK
jgi:hypothetical protein